MKIPYLSQYVKEDIDYFRKKLSTDVEAEQGGWLKDKYGVSCQIVPED